MTSPTRETDSLRARASDVAIELLVAHAERPTGISTLLELAYLQGRVDAFREAAEFQRDSQEKAA